MMTMCKTRVVALTIAGFVASLLCQRLEAALPTGQAPDGPSPAHYRATLDRYCVACHNDRAKTAGLALDRMDLARIPDDADVWERVVRKLRSGLMPPPGAPRPDTAARHTLTSWLESTLD